MQVQQAFNIASIVSEIRELIDLVIVDQARWEDVAQRLGERVPGSFVAMIGQSTRRQSLNHMSSFNLDPDFKRSFAENYAAVNPWNPNWSAMKSGDILISEDMAPARLFWKSAFYEDWLKPLGRFDAGAGLQIRHGGSERIYLTIHYDPQLHADYGPAVSAIYRGIRGHLDRAVLMAEKLVGSHEPVLAKAALLGHGEDCALVIDQDMQVVDGNSQAQAAFTNGDFLLDYSGRLRDGRAVDLAPLRQMIAVLDRGGVLDNTRRYVRTGESSWLVRLFSLPAATMNFASIFPSRRLYLMLAGNLSAGPTGTATPEFSAAFHLTAAERAMCEILAHGATVERAAERLGIARDTARQRLKSIFRKTDTNRQAELVSLLIRAR